MTAVDTRTGEIPFEPVAIGIGSIIVGERHRQNLGDLAPLSESLDALGMLHPVVLTPDYQLVAGERRMHAASALGWTTVPCRIVHTLSEASDLLAAERDENTCRLDMAPTEEHALYEAILAVEKPKAAERQGTRTDLDSELPGNLPEGSTGRAKDLAASGTTRKRRTLEKVGQVKAVAADDTQPPDVQQAAKDALVEMDRTNKVDGAYRKTAEAKAKAAADRLLDAMEERLPGSKAEFARDDVKKRWSKSLTAASAAITMDPEQIAEVLEPSEVSVAEGICKSLALVLTRVREHQSPNLRLIGESRG